MRADVSCLEREKLELVDRVHSLQQVRRALRACCCASCQLAAASCQLPALPAAGLQP